MFSKKRKVGTQAFNFSNVGSGQGQAVLEDLLNLDIQRGTDSSAVKGWRTVTFPHETINPIVLGHSTPKSYVLTRTQLALTRRADFVTAMTNAASKAITDQVAKLGIVELAAWDAAKGWASPIILGPFTDFAGAIYDDVISGIMTEIRSSIVPNFGPDILEQAGWEPGRAVHVVLTTNITNNSFQWYSYGQDSNGNHSDIKWIAIGTSTTPKTIPPAIQTLINDAAQLIQNNQAEIAKLQTEVAQLKAKLGL